MPNKTYNGYWIEQDNQGYVPVDSRLPFWNPGNPNLSWGLEGISGINGKRYLHYPTSNFYVNEDGTVRAFRQQSIPIINIRGKNYIEVPVSGDKATSTWDTGSGTHTVQNYYRIPVGTTTKYVEPPVLQPKSQKVEKVETKPTQTNAQLVPKKQSTTQVKGKSELKKKPIPIPEDMKKGLAKVVDGVPHYEIEGDTEEIVKLIEEYMKNNTTQSDNVYIDTPTKSNHADTKDQQQDNASKSTTDQVQKDEDDVYFRTESTRTLPTVNVKEGDEGAYLYKYPHRSVNIYKVSPELAKYVQDNLSNNTQSQGSELKNFMYSTVPLQNLPNGELNDTVFHDVFTISSNSHYFKYFKDNVTHHIIRQYAHDAVGNGYHTDENKPVTLIDDLGMIRENEIPIDDNKVFVPQYYLYDGTPWKYHAYYLPYTDYKQSKEYKQQWSEKWMPEDFATDIHGKKHWMGYPVSNYDYFHDQLRNLVPIQSYQAVKDSLDQVNHSRPQNDTSGVGGFFKRLIGKNSYGGKLNYLNFISNGK